MIMASFYITVNVIIIILSLVGITSAELNYTTLPTNFVLVTQGEVANLQINFTGLTEPHTVELSSGDPRIFVLEQTLYELNVENVQTISIPVLGVSLGIDTMMFILRGSNGLIDPNLEIQPFVVKVKRPASPFGNVFTYVVLVWLMASYVTMGVKLEWKVIWGKLKRPFGVVIGALCQFIVMPGVAAVLSLALNLDNTAAVALIIVGSCPGGWLSNIFTLLLDCDLVLSLTMTFCSTVIALGFMPLNLFFYATPYTSGDNSLRIPFLQIFLQLITLVVPLFIGTYVAHRFPRAAEWFHRLLKPLALILIIVSFIIGTWANYFAFQSPADIYLCAILLPSVGAFLGLLIAKMTCLSNHSAITIAIETGAQNSLLAITVIGLSLPQPEADLMTRVPVIFILMVFILLFAITGITVIMKRFPGRYELPDDDDGLQLSGADNPSPSSAPAASDKSLSSRISGFGPKQLKATKSQTAQPTPPMKVDFDEIRRNERAVSRFNQGFIPDSEQSRVSRQSPRTEPPHTIYRATNSVDVDITNTNAKQVYL